MLRCMTFGEVIWGIAGVPSSTVKGMREVLTSREYNETPVRLSQTFQKVTVLK